MALNAAQFDALFINAFGDSATSFGVEIDATTDSAMGRAGEHTIVLRVVQDRAIEWLVDGEFIAPWKQYAKDDFARQQNADALRSKLVDHRI